jgi:hypothetical protein
MKVFGINRLRDNRYAALHLPGKKLPESGNFLPGSRQAFVFTGLFSGAIGQVFARPAFEALQTLVESLLQ